MTIKLSETQHAAIVEVSQLGYTVAKANTIKSLETKGLIVSTGGTHHELTETGREFLGIDAQESVETPKDNFTEVLGWEPDMREEESIESLLQGDPWELGDAITEDEAFLTEEDFVGIQESPFAGWELRVMADNADQFEGDVLAMIEEYKRTVAGWHGTEVWDGLSLEEIKEDIETAYPVGRQARRVHHRTLRNAFRRMAVAQSPESRKSIKITGKVGV